MSADAPRRVTPDGCIPSMRLMVATVTAAPPGGACRDGAGHKLACTDCACRDPVLSHADPLQQQQVEGA